jgi:deoxyribodipyrimidine photo-lyase
VRELETISSNPRVRVRRAGTPDPDGTCVVYWMQRSQRGVDNPALDIAVEAANALGQVGGYVFRTCTLLPLRHYRFLSEGIPDIAKAATARGIGFVLRRYPDHSLLKFCTEVRPALVVGDENPMREPERWRALAAKKLQVPFWTVDSDVIVPSHLLEKEQYAAFIIRKRLDAQLAQFLVKPNNLRAKHAWQTPASVQSLPMNFDITEDWKLDCPVSPVESFRGGTSQALRLLKEFVRKKLANYAERRNHPEFDGTSRLSPYLHFGHISPLTVALAVQAADVSKAAKESFLNELIVWRELAINFVTYNPNYDKLRERRTLGASNLGGARLRSAPGTLQRVPIGERRDLRFALECGATANGQSGMDAQLHAYVLGEENPRVEQDAV